MKMYWVTQNGDQIDILHSYVRPDIIELNINKKKMELTQSEARFLAKILLELAIKLTIPNR